ncbi:hypothetical protein [Clostridium guangxiense]|uniref:hypothetical protein n=1 Tax=Clostridium guangxiense TaxID=1662055 RepID=UPI001E4A49A2|nr:hypothetical protein [Clostridium guangxiense]MCD2347305.1 hypothetical protein [Clostridium guangxiense]
MLLFNHINSEDTIYCEQTCKQTVNLHSLSVSNYKDISIYNKNLILISNKYIKILDYNICVPKLVLNLDECTLINNPYSSDIYIDYKTGILSANNIFNLNSVNGISELNDNYCFILKNDIYYLLKISMFENCIKFINCTDEYTINYKNIKSFDLLDNQYNDIIKLQINSSSQYTVILSNDLYMSLLKKWIHSKLASLNDLNSTYYVWSKSLRDIIIFYYFSLPVGLKLALNNIIGENRTVDSLKKDDKIKIINILYNDLKEYKNSLMEFSAYFSTELFSEQSKDANPKFKASFDILQREMTLAYNQINTHINSCINELNHLTSYVYPELDIREAINKASRKRFGRNSLIYAGLTLITGGINFLVGAGINGSGIFDQLDREKINDNMEESKINIYLNNTINSLYTFIDKMMPRYIADINEMVANLAGSITPFYSNDDIKFLKVCTENNKLFLETSIDDNLLKRKQILVRYILDKTSKYETNFLQSSGSNVKRLTRAEYYKQLEGGK